jgi:glycosyltransferase involved in cell wall biosynthesis
MVGARDGQLLQEMASTAIVEFLPVGVDVDHFVFRPLPTGKNLLFMASSYKWHANHDSVRWLHDEIMPRIWARNPQTVLYITGADHTSDMRKWRGDSRVILTGFVPDERKVAALCSVLVVPMRLGAGIKLKILTALAMGKAVVTTSQGAEGVAGLEDNANCFIRDSKGDFADAVIRVLDDNLLRETLATNGRRLVCERYDWEVIVGQFESLLESVVDRRRHAESQPASMLAQ